MNQFFHVYLDRCCTPISLLLKALTVLLLGSVCFVGQAQAALTVNSVTLNGGTSTTVAPGATVTVVVSETNTGGSNWGSVRFRTIDSGGAQVTTCMDTPNHNGNGSFSESFNVAAPAAADTYDVEIRAYTDNSCGGTRSGTTTLTGGIVVMNAPGVPTAITDAPSSLTVTGATLNGTVSSNGASTAVTFDYGLTAAYGSSIVASPSPLASSATNTSVSAGLSGLTCATTYHFRVRAVNSYGPTPGADRSLTTTACVPVVIEFNSTGGNTATNGLHFYIEDSTKIQVKRLDNTGQVYHPNVIPTSNSLDNGVFLRANGQLYGPSHIVGGGFTPSGGAFNAVSLSATSPANPATNGVQQTANAHVGVNAGPQVNIIWKYTTPLEFLTAEVTLTIPAGYAVSAANPVRYYHAIDTYLGGSDQGCGVKYTDSNGKLVVGTYPPTSGTTCLSSTSLPPGATIVESFRERSGTFSRYCTADWSSFYYPDGNNCAVSQTSPLSNLITNTYRDTGVGIEYDFTATGTYTFSYDFVIGTTVVPPYDHLEIQHDGVGTLCPETITVLACTSSTLPCPVGSIVNTGTLTGTLTTAPGSPAVTKTPAGITLGSSASTQTISLQSAGAGAVTLGTSGLSTVPLNGTKCWNAATSSQSCLMTFANTPCVNGFECLETGATYNNPITASSRNPLYTKRSGIDFKFDVVALQGSGAQATGYTSSGNVTVELFDDTTPAPSCDAYAGPLASQTMSFAAGDAGRKTLGAFFNLPNAYRKVRCRVTDANLSPPVYGCSSDDFSVRPSAVTLVTTANATPPSVSATPAIKAGANFSLQATTSAASSYGGSLILDVTKMTAQNPSNGSTQQSGGTVGALTPATLTGNAGAVNATYAEVGYLYLAPGAYRDDNWSTVDAAAGDCITSTAGNANLSDVVDASGKFGCSIGNTLAYSLGRFYPEHFALVNSSFAPACSTFTYMGQPFTLAADVQAQNLNSAITANFSGVFAKATVAPELENANSGVPITVARLTGLGTPVWTAGQYPFVASGFSRLSSPDGPYDQLDIGLRVDASTGSTDSTLLVNRNMDESSSTVCTPDAAGTSDGTCSAVKVAAATKLRYGRLRMQNAYGSELLALPVPMEAQYWAGNYYTINGADNCTALPMDSIVMSGYVGALSACKTRLTPTGTITMSGGKLPGTGLVLTKPGTNNQGSVKLAVNVSNTVAGNTCVAATESPATAANMPWFGPNLDSRATFGIYKSPLIYRRENY